MIPPDAKKRVKATIDSVSQLSEQVVRVSLDVQGEYVWEPGQYLALSDQPSGGTVSYYSIASAFDEGRPSYLELAVAQAAFRYALRSGSTLYLEQPGGGVNWKALSSAEHVVLLAMGTGVAPLRAVIQHCQKERLRAPVTLVQGSRTTAECLFMEEFRAMEGSGFRYIPVLSREAKKGRSGHVQEVLRELPIVGAHYLVCGSKEMVEDVSQQLKKRGLPDESLFAEGY